MHEAQQARYREPVRTQKHSAQRSERAQQPSHAIDPGRLPLYTRMWGNDVPPWLRLSPLPHMQQEPPKAPLQRKERTTGLPDKLKASIESLSGLALDDVHVHYHSPKPAQVQALAYAQGTEIHVGPGQEAHLAHEAWHVVQQKQGRVQPKLQMHGIAVNADRGLEQEADVQGKRAMSTNNAAVEERVQSAPVSHQAVKSSGVTQCKFGFELELGVLLSKKDIQDAPETNPEAYSDPGLEKKPFARGKLISVAEDHASGGPRSDAGVRFEEHLVLTQEQKAAFNPSRIGVVPPRPRTKYPLTSQQKDEESKDQEAVPESTGQTNQPQREIKEEQGYTSILEIVTDAMDETDLEAAIGPMQEAYLLAMAINDATQGLTKRVSASTVLNCDSDLYLGYDDPTKHGQTLSANIQVSYGLQFAAISEMMKFHSQEVLGGGVAGDALVIKDAQRATTLFFSTIEKKVPSLKNLLAMPGLKTKLEGIVSLLSLYLQAGKSDVRAQGLDKNIVPLLIRHPLDEFVEQSLSKQVRDMFSDEQVIAYLLQLNKRGTGELLFQHREAKAYPGPISQGADQPTCGQWVKNVLSGQTTAERDIFHWFEETRKIGPEEGGPQVPLDVVLEARNVFWKTESLGSSRIPPEQWVPLAVLHGKKLQELHLQQH